MANQDPPLLVGQFASQVFVCLVKETLMRYRLLVLPVLVGVWVYAYFPVNLIKYSTHTGPSELFNWAYAILYAAFPC